MFDQDTFEVNGLTFKVEFQPDEDCGAPWDNEDGHGPVSDWTARSKRAGERVLSSDGGCNRYYGFAEAVKIAKRDCWGAKEKGETKAQRATKAAERDFEILKDWCDDKWRYVGVVVTLLDVEGEETHLSESLSGIDDSDSKYLDSVAKELAEGIARQVGDKAEIVQTTTIRSVVRDSVTA